MSQNFAKPSIHDVVRQQPELQASGRLRLPARSPERVSVAEQGNAHVLQFPLERRNAVTAEHGRVIVGMFGEMGIEQEASLFDARP